MDSDAVNGTNLTIRDYPEELHSTKARVVVYKNEDSEYGFKLDGLESDDPIVNIVPKEYFFVEGQVFTMGDEYGYFIKTEASSNGNYFATVLVFDITTNTDLVVTVDRVIVEVKPIFQYKYVGLTNASLNEYICGEPFYYDALAEPRVVAKPSKIVHNNYEHEVKYEMEDDYYVKDVSFGTSLYNEQALNYGDVGYNAYNVTVLILRDLIMHIKENIANTANLTLKI